MAATTDTLNRDGGSISDVSQLSEWTANITLATWPGRAGHQVVLEEPAAINSFSPRVYVVGGHNEGGILDDTWYEFPSAIRMLASRSDSYLFPAVFTVSRIPHVVRVNMSLFFA